MRNRHVRAYRALLRVYPRRFRADYQEEMTRVFAQQLHYARVTEGWTGVLRVWARSLIDLVATAPAEHLEREMLVASPADSRGKPATFRLKPSRDPWLLVGSLPFGVLLVMTVLLPKYLTAAFYNPPSMAGLPMGVVAIGVALIWAAFGLGMIRLASSRRWRAAALILFTVPAAALVASSPAFVLIILDAVK
jgi:hypothetical protein